MRASKTFSMPWIISVSDSTLCNDLIAFDALSGKLVLITLSAINVMFFGDEGLGANWIVTSATNKTFFMPLPCLVFHFLHACPKDIRTSIASSGKLSVVTWSTINSIGFGTKLLIHQRSSTFRTYETSLVPMFFFIRQVLGINTNNFAALIAIVGENIFVTFDTVWMIVS